MLHIGTQLDLVEREGDTEREREGKRKMRVHV